MESIVVRCPECGEILYVDTQRGYMIGNVILKDMIDGVCGCGYEFFSDHDMFVGEYYGR
jgi:hypothetical protein